ncbi:MAG: acyl carrier protein [Acidobacteriota bacterium]
MTPSVSDPTGEKRTIREKVVALAARRNVDARALNDGDVILESGALDSVALLELIMWMEATFDLTIHQTDLSLANLGTIDAIAAYLQRTRNGTAQSDRDVAR